MSKIVESKKSTALTNIIITILFNTCNDAILLLIIFTRAKFDQGVERKYLSRL